MLTSLQLKVRGELTRSIAELQHAPSNEELAARVGCTVGECESALSALADAHALLLHPGTRKPWVVHPFALSPGSCWIEIDGKGWWANCLYCAFGIASAVGGNADIFTRLGGERDHLHVRIRARALQDQDLLFHLSTPPRFWWDNVIHACSSFQPFNSEADIDRWCERHALPKGAVVPLSKMWDFSRDWYGEYISQPWRKRSNDEIQQVFDRHGFTSPFWSMS